MQPNVSPIEQEENNVPTLPILVLCLFSSALVTTGCFLYAITRKHHHEIEGLHPKGSDSQTSESCIDLLAVAGLTVKEWSPATPSARTLQKGSPVRCGGDKPPIDAWGDTPGDCRPVLTVLFSDCQKLVSFSLPDNSTASRCEDDDADDEDEGEVGQQEREHTVMDLVRAGVFKRTFDVLVQQPRCVLCSVCYKAGDTVAVSDNPLCKHEYHQDCILTRWLRRAKPHHCPVCRHPFTLTSQEKCRT